MNKVAKLFTSAPQGPVARRSDNRRATGLALIKQALGPDGQLSYDDIRRQQGFNAVGGPQQRHGFVGGLFNGAEGLTGSAGGAIGWGLGGLARGVGNTRDWFSGGKTHWGDRTRAFQAPYGNAMRAGWHQFNNAEHSDALRDLMAGYNAKNWQTMVNPNAGFGNRALGGLSALGTGVHRGVSDAALLRSAGAVPGVALAIGALSKLPGGTSTMNMIRSAPNDIGMLTGGASALNTECPDHASDYLQRLPKELVPKFEQDVRARANDLLERDPSLLRDYGPKGGGERAQAMAQNELAHGWYAGYAKPGDALTAWGNNSVQRSIDTPGMRPAWDVLEHHFGEQLVPAQLRGQIQAAGNDPSKWSPELQQGYNDFRTGIRHKMFDAEQQLQQNPSAMVHKVPSSYINNYLDPAQQQNFQAWKGGQGAIEQYPGLKKSLGMLHQHYNIAHLNGWDKPAPSAAPAAPAPTAAATPAPTPATPAPAAPAAATSLGAPSEVASFDRWIDKVAGRDLAHPEPLPAATPPTPVTPTAPATPAMATSPAAASPAPAATPPPPAEDAVDLDPSKLTGAFPTAPKPEPAAGPATPGPGATPAAAPATPAAAPPGNTGTPGAAPGGPAAPTPAATPAPAAKPAPAATDSTQAAVAPSAQPWEQAKMDPDTYTRTRHEITSPEFVKQCENPEFLEQNRPKIEGFMKASIANKAEEQSMSIGPGFHPDEWAKAKFDEIKSLTEPGTDGKPKLSPASWQDAMKTWSEENGVQLHDSTALQNCFNYMSGLLSQAGQGDTGAMWKIGGLVLGFGGVCGGLGSMLSGGNGIASMGMLLAGALGIAGGAGAFSHIGSLFGQQDSTKPPPAAGMAASNPTNQGNAAVAGTPSGSSPPVTPGGTADTIQQFRDTPLDQSLPGAGPSAPVGAPGAPSGATSPAPGPASPPPAAGAQNAPPAAATAAPAASAHPFIDKLLSTVGQPDAGTPDPATQQAALAEIRGMPRQAQDQMMLQTMQSHPQLQQGLKHLLTLAGHPHQMFGRSVDPGQFAATQFLQRQYKLSPGVAAWLVTEARHLAPQMRG